MLELHGQQLIGNEASAEGPDTFHGMNPATGAQLPTAFHEATAGEIDRAMQLAADVFNEYRARSVEDRATFLETIADEVDALGDQLLETANAETALPQEPRLKGERGRATNQMRLFAKVIREGSWVDPRIDLPQPDRKPLPKPDVRSMLVPIGPVVVFGASNFPLAISVVGCDTVSALGAGCPVVVKAHPAHPGTCELLGIAVLKAAEKCNMPNGVFSMVHGTGNEVGRQLTEHPATQAVAFTGSLGGGRAVFDIAAKRPNPIPVYTEMGSTNPVFVLPGALAERAKQIAAGYIQSVTLAVGQFCTNPGMVIGQKSDTLTEFVNEAASLAGGYAPTTQLHNGINQAFRAGVDRIDKTSGVAVAGRSETEADASASQAECVIFSTDVATFESNPHLSDEVFGPTSTVVQCDSRDEMLRIAKNLSGHLTATIHGTEEDINNNRDLLALLENKVGRIVFNGFPTGIEVCSAMHHGGPYPATTDGHFTSIGTGSILRFVRPVCYQGFPDGALPEELRNQNTRGVWRLVDNELTKDNAN